MLNILKTIKSFKYAFAGLRFLITEENNMRFHLFASIVALAISFVVGLSPTEWCFIVIAIASVWTAEAFNTAIENLCNLYTTDFHPKIKIIKDISASAVLFLAIMALIIGLIILGPKIIDLLMN